MTEEGFEPTHRELCPDNACVGLIGPDGRCKVCGTVGASAVADPRRQGMAPDADEDAADIDDDRELCPDGACIGLIGDDGRCKVCGTTGSGAPRPARGAPAIAPPVAAPALPADTDPDVDDDDRELCPDGSCIGLIGPGGTCKVCGLSRTSASP